MNISSQHYSLWLLPEAGLGKSLQTVIAKLAGDHDAPVFRPHLTLLGGIHTAPAVAVDAAARLARRLFCLSLKPRGMAHSQARFRCLFIDLILSHPLSLARQQACRLFDVRLQGYRPHISLLYGVLPKPQRQRLAGAVEPPKKPLRMDQLALVKMGEDNQPSYWRTYRKYRLDYA